MSEYSEVLAEMKDGEVRKQIKSVVGRNNPNDLATLFNTSADAFIANRDGSYSLDPKTHEKEDVDAFDAINAENRDIKKQEYTNSSYEEARNTHTDGTIGSFENQITRDQRASGMEGMGGLHSAYTSAIGTGLSSAIETAAAPIDMGLQAGIGIVDGLDIYSEEQMDQVRDVATITGLANNPTTKRGKKDHPIAATIGGVAGVLGTAVVGGSIGASTALAQNGIGVLGTVATKKLVSAATAGAFSGAGASSLKGDAEKFRSGEISAADYVKSIARSSVENAAFQLFGDVTQLATSSRVVNGFIDAYAGYNYDILTDKNREVEIGRFNPMNPDNWTASTMLDVLLSVGGNFVQGGTSYRVESNIMKNDLRRLGAALSLRSQKTKVPVLATGVPNAKTPDGISQQRLDRFAEEFDSYARTGSGALTNFGDKNNIHVNSKNFSKVFNTILQDAQLTEGDIAKYLKELDVSNEVYTKRYKSAKDFMKELEVSTARRTKLFNDVESDYRTDDATIKTDLDKAVKYEDDLNGMIQKEQFANNKKAQKELEKAEKERVKNEVEKEKVDKAAEDEAEAIKEHEKVKEDDVVETTKAKDSTVPENGVVEAKTETLTESTPVKAKGGSTAKLLKKVFENRKDISKEDIDLLVGTSVDVAKKLSKAAPEKLFGAVNHLRKLAGKKLIMKSDHLKGDGKNLPSDQRVEYKLDDNDPYIQMLDNSNKGKDNAPVISDNHGVFTNTESAIPVGRTAKQQVAIDNFDKVVSSKQMDYFESNLREQYNAKNNKDVSESIDTFVKAKLKEATTKAIDGNHAPNTVLKKISKLYAGSEVPDSIINSLRNKLDKTLGELDRKSYNPKEYSAKIDNFATRYFAEIDRLKGEGQTELADIAIQALDSRLAKTKNSSQLTEYYDVYKTSKSSRESTPIKHSEELEFYRQAIDENPKLRTDLDKVGLSDQELTQTEGYAVYQIGDKYHAIYPKKGTGKHGETKFEYAHSKKGSYYKDDAVRHLAELMAERKVNNDLDHTLKGKDWIKYVEKQESKLGKFTSDKVDTQDQYYKKYDPETGKMKEDWTYNKESNQLHKSTPSGFKVTKTPAIDQVTGKSPQGSAVYHTDDKFKTFDGDGDPDTFSHGKNAGEIKAEDNYSGQRFDPTEQDKNATNSGLLQQENVSTSELGLSSEIEGISDVSGGLIDADRGGGKTDGLEINDPDAAYVSQEMSRIREHTSDKEIGELNMNPFVTQSEAVKWHSFLGRESFDRAVSDIMDGAFHFDNIVTIPGTKQMTYVKNATKSGMVQKMTSYMAEDMLDAAGRIFGKEFIPKKTTVGIDDIDNGYAVNQGEFDLMKTEDAEIETENTELFSKMSTAGNAISAIKDFFKSRTFVEEIAGNKDAAAMIKEFENYSKKYYDSPYEPMAQSSMIYKQQYAAIKDNKAQLQDRFGSKIVDDLIFEMERGNDVSDYILVDPALSKSVFKNDGISTNLMRGYKETYKSSGAQGPTVILGKDPSRFSADKNFGTEYRSEDSRFIYLDNESIKSSGRTANDALAHELGHKLYEEILPPEAKLGMFKKYVKNKDIKKSLKGINKSTNGAMNTVYGNYYNDIMKTFGTKADYGNLQKMQGEIESLSSRINKTEKRAEKAFEHGDDVKGDEYLDLVNDMLSERREITEKYRSESGSNTSDPEFIAEVGAEMMAHRMLDNSGASEKQIDEIIKVSEELSTDVKNNTRALMENSRIFSPMESKIHTANSKLFVETEGLMRNMYKSVMNKNGYKKGLNVGDGTLASTMDLGRMYFASADAIKAMGLQKSHYANKLYNKPMEGDFPRGLHLPDTKPKDTRNPEVRRDDYAIGSRQQALGISENIISSLKIKDVDPHIHYGIKRLLTGENSSTKLQSADFAKFYAENFKVIDQHVKRYGFLKKGMDLGAAIKNKGLKSAYSEARNIYSRELSKFNHNAINRKNYLLSITDDVMKNFAESTHEYLSAEAHVEAIRKAEYSGTQTEMNISKFNNGISQIGLTHQELNLFSDWRGNKYVPNSVLRSKFERLDTLMDELIVDGQQFAVNNNIDFKSVDKKNVIDFTNDYIDSMTSIDYGKLKSEFASIVRGLERTQKGRDILKSKGVNLVELKSSTFDKLNKAGDKNAFITYENSKVKYYTEDSGLFDFYNEGDSGLFSDNSIANNSVKWLNNLYYKNVLIRNGAFLVSGTLRDYHTFKRKSEMDSIETVFSSIPKYAKNIKKAFKDLRNKDNNFSDEYVYLAENGLLASTGTKGGILSKNEINNRLKRRISKGSDLSTVDKVKGFVPGIEMFVEDLLTATDRASRYTEFDYIKELEGVDFKMTAERANNIRNLGNPNPFEKGARSNEIGSVLMFYNSIIRGFAEDVNHGKRLYKKHGNNKNKLANDLMKRNAVAVLPTIVFALADLGLFGQDTKEVYNKTSIKDLASGKSTPVAGIYNKSDQVVGSVNSSLGILDEQQQILSQMMMMAYKGGTNLIEEIVGQPRHDSDVGFDDAINIIKTTLPGVTPVIESIVASYHLGTDTYFTDNFNSPVVNPNDGFGTNALRTVGHVSNEFGFGIFQNNSNWADKQETKQSVVGDVMNFKSYYFLSKIPVVDLSVPYVSNAASFMGKQKRFNPNAMVDYGEANEANAKERLKSKYGSK